MGVLRAACRTPQPDWPEAVSACHDTPSRVFDGLANPCRTSGVALTRGIQRRVRRRARDDSRRGVQNFTLNTPFVTILFPVAFVPVKGTSVSENVPDAELAVLDVTMMVPVPPLVAVALHSEF